jgi:hypothetical protein
MARTQPARPVHEEHSMRSATAVGVVLLLVAIVVAFALNVLRAQ